MRNHGAWTISCLLGYNNVFLLETVVYGIGYFCLYNVLGTGLTGVEE